MYVETILKRKGTNIVSTSPDETIAAVVHLLESKRIGAALVLDEAGEVAGIISERDIVQGMARHGERIHAMKVSEMMTADVVSCRPQDTIEAVMNVMTESRFRHMPVVDDGGLCGVISIGDVVKQRIADTEMEVDVLRQYVGGGS